MARPHAHVRRAVVGAATAATAVLGALAPASSPAAAVPQPPAAAKISRAVAADLATNDSGTFLVEVAGTADLSRIPAGGPRAERTDAVFRAKRGFAERSQAAIRQVLTSRDVEFTPYWIANVIKVRGDRALAEALARRSDVVRVIEDKHYEIPKPANGKAAAGDARAQAVEWNIAQIGADRVWSEFGVRGDGVVVANIDTGVDHTHPTLAGSYRGNLGEGRYDHDYNWFDPSQICASPSLAPCDNAGHGTHTMGTMVGDDGQGNRIGVAPGARWISAKGCEEWYCSESALLAAGQWVVAPTDLNGRNPRPDLAPHVVNNSWGGLPDDPLFRETVATWVAAGIFPTFSIGNWGPGCNTAASPGDYESTYGVGAYASNGQIAAFSGRGPGAGAGVKPDIAAPGVAVRSAFPGNTYYSWDGTSMAAPHVSGTVALLWSASPGLVGNIEATRELLDTTAVDTPNAQCGGTDGDNNVFGEGKLDAFAAVERAPRGPIGGLSGVVTSGGEPVAGALVQAVGPIRTARRTNPEGGFTMPRLPVGTYTVTVSLFGYVTRTAAVTIAEGGTATLDSELPAAPRHTVRGTVREADGSPVSGARVTAAGTPLPVATTDDGGTFELADVPSGEYVLRVEFGGWLNPATQQVAVQADTAVEVVLQPKTDAFGYVAGRAEPAYVEAPHVLPLSGWDGGAAVRLPFPFTLYGETYRTANVSINGFLTFGPDPDPYWNGTLPNTGTPNAAVYAFWDDLFIDQSSSVRTETLGSAPNRRFVVEWRNAGLSVDPGKRVNAEIVLGENGLITLQYSGLDPADPIETGGAATVGVENADGTVALQYSANEAVLSDDVAITFRVPGAGLIRGAVTDANDRDPVSAAKVTVRGGATVRETVTDGEGMYQVQVPPGSYTVQVEQAGYQLQRHPVTVAAQTLVDRDFLLAAPRVETVPGGLTVVVPAGQTRTRTITVRNTGSAPGTFEVAEVGGGVVPPTSTAASRPSAQPVPKPVPKDARGLDPVAPTGKRAPRGTAAVGNRAAAAGAVLRSWRTGSLDSPFGVGYDGTVWIGNQTSRIDAQFTTDGRYRKQISMVHGDWPGDLAMVPSRDLMCQATVGGDNAIRCWDRADGSVEAVIGGPWARNPQMALAYRADDDSFYVGGWYEGTIYHVRGLSHREPGSVISQCVPADPSTAGLAWSPRGLLWQIGNSEREALNALNPDTCETVQSVPDPDPRGYSGGGLEIDEVGNLWTLGRDHEQGHRMYLVDSGVPSFTDVPWLRGSPGTGALAPGESERLQVTIDATGLAPGVYGATVIVGSDSPRQPYAGVPIKLVVPKYQAAFDAGNAATGVDVQGDPWRPDQAYSTGGAGYLGTSTAVTTIEPVAGTPDPWLYATGRQGAYEYRFDGLPEGTYEVELDFAELSPTVEPNARVFDVVLERQLVLPGFDIVGENGLLKAARHTFTVSVTDGQLNVRLLARLGQPLLNGVRVTERPDLTPPG